MEIKVTKKCWAKKYDHYQDSGKTIVYYRKKDIADALNACPGHEEYYNEDNLPFPQSDWYQYNTIGNFIFHCVRPYRIKKLK